MSLFDYLKKIGLPNIIIESKKEVSSHFINNNVFTLWDAIEHVHRLPYGRTTCRENYLQVLGEGKGSCSAKHALIAALAEEIFIPLKLALGIFLMTVKNTPTIGPILKHYHLDSIPEAHCYVKYDNNILDITFPKSQEFVFDVHLEHEINLTPKQIGLFKIEEHHKFIKAWLKNNPSLNFDLVWNAREQYIRELSYI